MGEWLVSWGFELVGSGIAGGLAWLMYRHFRATAFAGRSTLGGDYRPAPTGWLAALLGPLLGLAITLLLFGLALMMVIMTEEELFGRIAGLAFFLGAGAWFAWLTAKAVRSSVYLLLRSISREGDVIVTRSWFGVARYPLGDVVSVAEGREDFEFVFADGRKLTLSKLIRGAGHLANAAAMRAGLEPFNPQPAKSSEDWLR